MGLIDEVNRNYQKSHPAQGKQETPNPRRVAEEILRDVRWQFLNGHHALVTVGKLVKRQEFQISIPCFVVGINARQYDCQVTLIHYESGSSVEPHVVRDVMFASKREYLEVFDYLQQLCKAEGISVRRSRHENRIEITSPVLYFSIPKT